MNIFRLVSTCVLPFSSLAYLYTRIYQGLRYSHAKKSQARNEMNKAAILICIVTIFLVSNIPRVVLNCFEFVMLDQIIRCGDQFIPPTWFLCLASFSNLTLVSNASANFNIYCVVGSKFKKAFKNILNSFR